MSHNRPSFFSVSPAQAATGMMVQLTGPTVGAIVGVVRSIGGSAAEMACNAKCDGFYGAAASLAFNISLLALNHYLNKPKTVTYTSLADVDDEENNTSSMKP